MVDYIIVGCGLAGIAFAETAIQNNKSVFVFDDDSQNSSKIAGGLYNPVILKRFSKLHHAQQQLDELQEFYKRLESKLDVKLNYHLPVFRKLFSIEEQNNWFEAADKPGLSAFLSTKLILRNYNGITSPFGYGEVLQSGYVDTSELIRNYRNYLEGNNLIANSKFDYDAIEFGGNTISYKNIKSTHIIFAEGFGMHANPFFRHLPLDGTKGELFIIKAPELNLDVIVNTNVFILPLGNALFKVGATYNWDDKTNDTTEEGRAELVEKIKGVINCDFEIIEHLAGMRPTVKDRRPLLGTHPDYSNLHILNGLGTRGVMLGPYVSKILFEHIETKTPIPQEYDITRFKI